MKIAFVWDWENEAQYLVHWKDGIAAAMRELNKRHDVKVFTAGNFETVIPTPYFNVIVAPTGPKMINAVGAFDPDVIVMWADMTRPNTDGLKQLGKPMTICFAGGSTEAEHWYKFHHIFVENEEYKAKYENQGFEDVTVAFGTNTEHFDGLETPKNFDVYFPATFADWKRHNLLAASCNGMSTICTGVMYKEREDYCWKVPMKAGSIVAPYVSADVTRMLMAQSKCVLIPSSNVGGSQRTVLEALAMNVPVIVMEDNIKCCEYLRQAELDDWIVEPNVDAIREKVKQVISFDQKRNTRQFIMDHWSEYIYAERIEQVLTKLHENTIA